jgi:cell division septation protein DedD
LIWGGVALFVAGWMFVLGIMVGRGTAPVNLEADKLERELVDLKDAVMQKQKAEIDAQTSGQGNAKPQLGFYEALKDPKKVKPHNIKKPTKPVKKPPAPKPAQPKKPQPKKPTSNSTKVAKAVPQSTVRDSDTAPAHKGHYTIQVAAVRETGSATSLVTQLRSKGYPAYQVRVEVPGKGAWHRVRVGAFKSRGAADRMLAKLKANKLNGMVVSTK